MELLYIAGSNQNKQSQFLPLSPMLTLSKKNLIAISTTVDLLKTNSHIKRSSIEHMYYIYVFDIESPSNINLVTILLNRVVEMKWHDNSNFLYLVTEAGTFYIYQMKDYVLNFWINPPIVLETLEDIVSVTWLQTSAKIGYSTDKILSNLYSEKFIDIPNNCQMKKLGGQVLDGALLVTASGKVYVQTIEKPQVFIAPENLCDMQHFISIADCVISSGGTFALAYSDGKLASPIRCLRLSLTYQMVSPNSDKMQLEFKHNSGIILTSVLEKYSKYVGYVSHITHIDESSLIIAYCVQEHSEIGIWTLQNKTPSPIHKFFTQRNPAITRPMTLEWTSINIVEHSSLVTAVAIPRLILTPNSSESLFQYVAVAYQDGSVKLINVKNFISMTTTNLDTAIIDSSSGGMIGDRKNGLNTAYMTSMIQSYTGCILVGIDQKTCVYVMKVVNTRDPVTQMSRQNLLSMLEYCIYTGTDSWDIIVAIKPSITESMLDSMFQNFSRQPLAYKELLEPSYLRVRLALSTYCSQYAYKETYSHIMLSSIYAHLKLIFKTENPDNIQNSNFEGSANELEYLLQWVLDLAIFLLGQNLQTATPQFLGSSLINDQNFLCMLRQAINIVKLCISTKLFNASFQLPSPSQFGGSFQILSAPAINIDVIVRLLASLSTKIQEESYQEDIQNLTNILTPNTLNNSQLMEKLFGPPKNFALSPLLQVGPPLRYVFGETVDAFYGILWDNLRQIIIGKSGLPHKRCARCGSKTSLQHLTDSQKTENLSWIFKFQQNCICGGFWVNKNVT